MKSLAWALGAVACGICAFLASGTERPAWLCTALLMQILDELEQQR